MAEKKRPVRRKYTPQIDGDLTRRLSRDDPGILSFVYLSFSSNMVMKLADEQLRKSKLSVARYTILRILEDGEPQPLSYLSDKHFCEAGNITRLVAKMEEDGLLQRRLDQQDRRITRVSITDLGKELLKSVSPEHREFIRELMSEFSAEELATLSDLLERLSVKAMSQKSFVR